MSDTATALARTLMPLGELSKPVPPGGDFVSLPPAELLATKEGLEDISYPPVVADNPGCRFNGQTSALQATVWGRVVFTNAGIRVKPCWMMSKDKMSLSMEVDHEDCFGKPVTMDRLLRTIPKALEGIPLDLDYGALEEGLKQAQATGETVTVTLAQGNYPGEGRDAMLSLAFSAGTSAGTLRDDGSMDFRERADIYSVAEGDVIGTLYPAMVGDYGSDLYGNPIKPPEVKTLRLIVGDGIEATLQEDNSVVYTATRVGVARFRNDVLEVVDMLEIPGDVDFSVGNIRAKEGSVHIKGDVKCGFVVECAGDVVVDGVVEEADILAGGLVVAGGVIMSGNNVIKAEGDVSAHFFRNAIVEAGGDVHADQEMAHCTVTAKGKVQVLGEQGIISGGHIISYDSIHASVIGNKSGVETCVEIRFECPECDKLDAARKQFKQELAELDKTIGVDFDLSKLMKAPEEDRRILAELIKVRGRIQKEERSIVEAKQALVEDNRTNMAKKRVSADKMVYPGTTVVISGRHEKVIKDMVAPIFRLDADTNEIVSD
ncbi:FapA family protein [Pseudodesulfovibrio sp. zrk46]|uniref:FapA family protein n=1 Tax=Pseudodesulfovibrio sp. zrk46 TaxID=2725288 RepID=UPI001448E84D|nr:FapA family protein [Pseudodesulfovibrio sp. zrk46]QJB55516.1 DUF342 domain-containing protein [Pseudodesulfovibrio sp. zrk46]